jgi:hypothetical protein
VVFHLAHRSTLSVLGWKSMDAEKAEQLKSTVRDQTRILLEHWSRERDARHVKDAKGAKAASKPPRSRKQARGDDDGN